MRCAGQALVSLKVFCGLMNLPPSVKESSYSLVIRYILSATSTVAKDSIKDAAIKEAQLSTNRDITVLCDGT